MTPRTNMVVGEVIKRSGVPHPNSPYHKLAKLCRELETEGAEALEILRELHTYLDFDEPMTDKELFAPDDPTGVNAAFARAYALIERTRATPSPTKGA